ncbi:MULTISPECIES: hypothetical protein [unclassified Rhizobium]|uniref:hypothetical protein n=1 Tax=Rhizobium sp. BG4 TaxID=2613770 RepID=UPI00193DE109|nr:hypothetical protein [Rhizobium sp. BG4]QRM47560.1 hypothetical protein F2982_30210 [Rhizobium sp. BG4]
MAAAAPNFAAEGLCAAELPLAEESDMGRGLLQCCDQTLNSPRGVPNGVHVGGAQASMQLSEIAAAGTIADFEDIGHPVCLLGLERIKQHAVKIERPARKDVDDRPALVVNILEDPIL